MQILNVSQNSMVTSRKNKPSKNLHQSNINFGTAYVPTTRKYASIRINEQIRQFNETILPQILPEAKRNANAAIKRAHAALGISRAKAKVKSASDFATDYNCFVLAGGPGSRFQPLSDPIGKIRKKKYNKISTPFEYAPGMAPFTMATPAMTLEAVFAAGTKGIKKAAATGKASAKAPVDDFGYQKYTKSKERGNFWHIIDHYMKHPKEIKDTVIISGDNAFDLKADEMIETMVRMKEEGQHLTMFGVKKDPKDVADKFGVIGAQAPHREADGLMALNSFQEKPPIARAIEMAQTSDGINIANTGSLVISKEAMTAIVKIAKEEEAYKKQCMKKMKMNDPDITPEEIEAAQDLKKLTFSRVNLKTGEAPVRDRYDFSTVQGWILHNMYTPEQIQAGKGPIVQMLAPEKWSDVGEPDAMFEMLENVGSKGSFLQNFPQAVADKVQQGIQKKTNLAKDGSQRAIVVTNKYESLADVPEHVMAKAPSVLGVKIIG